ncbi:MAG: hypothetical protein ABDH20_12060 [Thermus sp.]
MKKPAIFSQQEVTRLKTRSGAGRHRDRRRKRERERLRRFLKEEVEG